MAESPELTRRRVLVGVAWATPAVLVATAVPAAAASGGPASIVIAQTTATMTATTLYARSLVSWFGDVGPSPDAPIGSVRIEFTVPRNRITAAGVPTFTGAGWTYTGRATVGSNYVFTFTWVGTDLSHTNTATTLLVASIPKATSVNTLDVGMAARGVSNFADVSSIATVAASNAGTIDFAAGASTRIAYVANRNLGGGLRSSVYRMRGTVRNTGATPNGSRPGASAISGVSVDFEIAAANVHSAGEIYETDVGAGWTRTAGPTLSDGRWHFTYTWSGADLVPPNNTAVTRTLEVMMRAVGTNSAGIAAMTARGTSEGLSLVKAHIGP